MFLKRIFLFLFLLFITKQVFADEDLKIKIFKNVRCLVCQGQSIYESNSDFAIDLKNIISKKLSSGESEIQIYQFLISRYGEWIIFTPMWSWHTLILWIFPIFILICGGILVFRFNKVNK